MIKFHMPLLITVADIEHETDITVRGHYEPAQRATMYEPGADEHFETDSVDVVICGIRHDFSRFINDAMWDAISAQGCREAGYARDTALEDAAEMRREDAE